VPAAISDVSAPHRETWRNIVAVVDWKSDVAPSESDYAHHLAQMAEYLTATRTKRGALVYMTRGEVVWLKR